MITFYSAIPRAAHRCSCGNSGRPFLGIACIWRRVGRANSPRSTLDHYSGVFSRKGTLARRIRHCAYEFHRNHRRAQSLRQK
jgi:hypothetical protein